MVCIPLSNKKFNLKSIPSNKISMKKYDKILVFHNWKKISFVVPYL